MTQLSKEVIIAEAKKLAKMIAQTEEVAFFKQAEVKVHNNQKVKQSIKEIKSLQKQAVNLEHYGKKEALRQTEEQINQLQEEIDLLPIVQQFQSSQVEVNALLQLITDTISQAVDDELVGEKE